MKKKNVKKYENTLFGKRHTLGYICEKYKKREDAKYFDQVFFNNLYVNIVMIFALYFGLIFLMKIPLEKIGWYYHMVAIAFVLFILYLLKIKEYFFIKNT